MLSALAADRARVADIEAQILLLEHSHSLLELKSEKQLVQERLDSYTYPVLTLPNEIVTEIFVHFLPVYPLYPPLTGPGSPTLLAQICREWRDIALATPALWQAISLSDRYEVPLHLRLCDMWLSRSRCHPLSLGFDEFALSSSQATDALSALVPHRARWQHLHIYALSPSRLDTLQGPMPLLRSLDLSLAEMTDPFAPQVLLREMPLLRTVVLNDAAAGRLILPWVQLTSLTLRWLYPRECAPILQNTLNLVHCDLGLVDDDDEGTPDITLPALRSLTLRGRSIPGYLETLIVPALHNLRISHSFLPLGSIDTALASFVSKSSCKLQDLCLTGRVVSQDPYRKAFPLAKISVDDQKIDD
ncbi:hypothetical protein B0H14DRAFT_1339843 [Mycena olivaceomarginata]|nr:hypothetical protein B0H14DRAFT_1339843 [Mycena olivaceomarginata]